MHKQRFKTLTKLLPEACSTIGISQPPSCSAMSGQPLKKCYPAPSMLPGYVPSLNLGFFFSGVGCELLHRTE